MGLEDLDTEPLGTDPDGSFLSALETRRGTPVPKRSGLHGVLRWGSNLSPRANAGALGETVQEIMDQFSGIATQYDVERPRNIEVQVRKDLPALASRFDFSVVDDPKNTQRLNDLIQQSLRAGKYAVTEKEWRGAARALEPFVREGNLKVLMQLGVANGPFLHRLNYREAITAALWMEGLVTAPQSAGLSDIENRRLQLRPLGEMAVAGKKRQGIAFGVGSPQLARAFPFVLDVGAPSVGFRSGPESKGNRLLTPKLFEEGGPFTAMNRVARKDLRALENAASGVDVALARKNVKANANFIISSLTRNMSSGEISRLLQIAGLSEDEMARLFKEDRVALSTKLFSALRSSAADQDLHMSKDFRTRLISNIEENVFQEPKNRKVSVTNFTKAAVEGAHASPAEAMRALKKTKVKGVDPKILKGLGKAPFILALAAIISSGLIAAGSSEEAA